MWQTRFRLILFPLLALACAAGCSLRPRPQSGPSDVGVPEFFLLPGQPQDYEPITIGVTSQIDPDHAPLPRNDSERLLFSQLYETMVRVDGEGRLRAGLAADWTSDDGLTWTFHLRPEARFSDGSPVRPHDIRAAWVSAHARALAAGETYPWDWIAAIPWPEDTDKSTISVVLCESRLELPLLFVHPALAVTKPDVHSDWPLGTGAYRLGERGAMPGGTRITLLPTVTGDRGSLAYYRSDQASQAELRFMVLPGADQRDLLTAGADLVLVRERTVIDYCDGLADYERVPLPWDRLYILVSPWLCPEVVQHRHDPLSRGASRARPDLPGILREELAANVPSEARPVDDFTFWTGDTLYEPADTDAGRRLKQPGLPGTGSGVVFARRTLPLWEDLRRDPEILGSDPSGGGGPRILYQRGDEDAARVAGRLAVLLSWNGGELIDSYGEELAALVGHLRSTPDAGVPTAPGVGFSLLWSSLQNGDDAAYILGLDRAAFGAMDHGCAHPILASRQHLVARRGLRRIGLEWDGSLRLDRAGWQDEGPRP